MPRPEVQGRDVDCALDVLPFILVGEPDVDEDGAVLDHRVHFGRGELGTRWVGNPASAHAWVPPTR